MELEEFADLLRLENRNLEAVREEEPFLDDALAYIVMALAHDCIAWDEPMKGMEANLGLIESVARYACLISDKWKPEGVLVFGNGASMTQENYQSLFTRSKGLRDALLQQHLATYGRENEIQALRETNTCLTYMIAIGCARSTDLEGSLAYVDRTFRDIMKQMTDGQ